MPGHRLGDFVERLSTGGTAESKTAQALRRRSGLQEALLQGLAKGMRAILPLTQVAQAIEKLTMVGRQDHNFRIVAA